MPTIQENRGEFSHKEQEKRIYDILEKDLITFGWFEKKEITIVYIDTNLFSVGTEKNISLYCDEKWNVLFNIADIRTEPRFRKSLSNAGYHEIKNPNGEYDLFRINRTPSTSNKEVIRGEKIPLYSREYFSAWEDILFYKAKIDIDITQRQDSWSKNYLSLGEEDIRNFYIAKSLRARDLIFFLEHKQITRKVYDTYIWNTLEQLPSQIGDLRFNRIRDNVTISEIQEYLKRKMITKEVYDILSKRIKSRDELLGNKEFSENEIKKGITSMLDALKRTIAGK